MTIFSLNSKNTLFGLFLAHFPYFCGNKGFSKKSDRHAQLHKGFWHLSKKTPWQMSGEKDAQTLFHRVLPATARDLTSTIAVDWYLKVKDIEYGVGLTENYCITVGMQTKISSILNFFQQILGSHVLNGHAYFWPSTPKNHWNNF